MLIVISNDFYCYIFIIFLYVLILFFLLPLEKHKGSIVEKFDEAIKTVASLHNLSIKQIEDYFDKEVIEKLGEK